MHAGAILVIGTFDTKGAELAFLARAVADRGWPVVTIDVGTREPAAAVTVTGAQVAATHPGGAAAVRSDDRGRAIAAMSEALQAYVARCPDVAGAVALGGSGGTALIAPALRRLPVGVPKVILSTVASGNVAPYIGESDLVLMPSVTDVAGLNRLSRLTIANAAAAVTAMAAASRATLAEADGRPSIAMTMFGVTTPCVQRVGHCLDDRYDCLVFHATGTGGRTMESLVDAGLVGGVIDVTLTEVADLVAGGTMAATEDRLGAIARTAIPYVGSVGACDMVNFGAADTVPERFAGRRFYAHNQQVTLMRTTPAECRAIGRFIAAGLNACPGPVRFFLPEGGVSAIDAPGQPFHDAEADAALFDTIEAEMTQSDHHRLVRLPYHINDPAFADALCAAFGDLMQAAAR